MSENSEILNVDLGIFARAKGVHRSDWPEELRAALSRLDTEQPPEPTKPQLRLIETLLWGPNDEFWLHQMLPAFERLRGPRTKVWFVRLLMHCGCLPVNFGASELLDVADELGWKFTDEGDRERTGHILSREIAINVPIPINPVAEPKNRKADGGTPRSPKKNMGRPRLPPHERELAGKVLTVLQDTHSIETCVVRFGESLKGILRKRQNAGPREDYDHAALVTLARQLADAARKWKE